MRQILLIFIGGGLGSCLRFLIGKWLNSAQSGIPYGTLAANVLGSLVIGLILGWALKNEMMNSPVISLIAVGFCGGFTTFSTFAYENHVMLRNGDLANFALYTVGSLLVGFAAVFLGMWLSKQF